MGGDFDPILVEPTGRYFKTGLQLQTKKSVSPFPFGWYWHEHAAFQSVGIRAADWQRR